MQKTRKKLVKRPRQSQLVINLEKKQNAVNEFTTRAVNQVKQMSKNAESTVRDNTTKDNQKQNAFVAKFGPVYDYKQVAKIQQSPLKEEGYYEGNIDGDWGKDTEAAWQQYSNFQQGINFPGIQIPLVPVDRLGRITPECATYSNTFMRSLGLKAEGHSYQVGSHYAPVINGYDNLDLSRGLSEGQIMDLHRQAADYVMRNLDTLSLRKSHIYPVNMYYYSSPHMVEYYEKALDENTGTPGTHTGILYNNGSQWMVGHNISTNVHNEPVSEVLGGRSNPHKYGVTAVYDAGAIKKNLNKKKK